MDAEMISDQPEEVSKKMKNIDQQIMTILKTILERCKKETRSNCLQVPLEDFYERVSFYTALPKMFIYHVIDDNNISEDDFDIKDHIVLLQCINKLLAKLQEVNIKKLYEEFLQDKKTLNPDSKYNGDLKTFERKIYSLGYVFKKNLKGPSLVLVENPKWKFERFNYLYKIKNYREKNRQIYYVDERQIFSHPYNNPLKEYAINAYKTFNGLIFFHIISITGYEIGIFVCQETDRTFNDIFKKWMIDIVIHNIKPSSVIVMGNNAIHGLQSKKPITRYHSRAQMLKWLRENNIPCSSNMEKPRLYELVEKCTRNNEDYDIDRIFKLHGHDVLRLPTTFPSMTPTHFLWELVNRDVKMCKPIGASTYSLLNHIKDLSKQNWIHFVNKTKSLENQVYEADLLNESLLENNYELDEKTFYDDPISSFNIEDIIEKELL